MIMLTRIQTVLCILLLVLVTSCGRRPPPPASSGNELPSIAAGSVDTLIHANAALEQQLSTERELRHKAEQRLALEQSWRGRWQMMACIAAVAAALALLIGMGLGSHTRKEAEDSHDDAS